VYWATLGELDGRPAIRVLVQPAPKSFHHRPRPAIRGCGCPSTPSGSMSEVVGRADVAGAAVISPRAPARRRRACGSLLRRRSRRLRRAVIEEHAVAQHGRHQRSDILNGHVRTALEEGAALSRQARETAQRACRRPSSPSRSQRTACRLLGPRGGGEAHSVAHHIVGDRHAAHKLVEAQHILAREERRLDRGGRPPVV